jgi:hypothetical protein
MNHRWVLESPTLPRALVLSLLLHALVFVGIEFGRVLGWWNPSYSFFARSAPKAQESEERIVIEFDHAKPKPTEAPLTFVEVTPSQATSEPPKAPKYYSSNNSRAANPDTTIDSNLPRITGTQDKVPKTVDTARALTPPPPPDIPIDAWVPYFELTDAEATLATNGHMIRQVSPVWYSAARARGSRKRARCDWRGPLPAPAPLARCRLDWLRRRAEAVSHCAGRTRGREDETAETRNR